MLSDTCFEIDMPVTVKQDAVVCETGSDASQGALRQPPFVGDPITAQRFLHAMYQGMGV